MLVKSPDDYLGETYFIYGEVTQFDSATGEDALRANTGAKRKAVEYGMTDYDVNTMMTGSKDQLADVVQGDVFSAKVTSLGSFSYDTQIGGNTTVPLFEIDQIEVYDSTED